ncbi:MAG: hypothetical protein MUO85_03200, partial [candidate division Zixibacteria bacterium]|nr:hypothetical protein [candidate division Zixibacteria bacterium]
INKGTKILKEQLEREKFDYSPYVLGQCLEAISLLDPSSEEISIICNKLMDYLSNVKLDFANFINICLALHGLWIAPVQKNYSQLRISTSSLFGDTCFRDNGSWYRSEIHTAWAIITLTRYSKEVVLNAPYSEIYSEVRKKQNEILENARQWSKIDFRRFTLNLILSCLCGVLLGFFITYTTLKDDIAYWLKWALGAAILSLITNNVREIMRRKKGK